VREGALRMRIWEEREERRGGERERWWGDPTSGLEVGPRLAADLR